jgi:hypothetical protein
MVIRSISLFAHVVALNDPIWQSLFGQHRDCRVTTIVESHVWECLRRPFFSPTTFPGSRRSCSRTRSISPCENCRPHTTSFLRIQ